MHQIRAKYTAVVTNPTVWTTLHLGLENRSLVSVQLVTDGTLDGSWAIKVNNGLVLLGSVGKPANAGVESDITTQFRDADGNQIAVVAHGTASTQNQFVSFDRASAAYMQFVFTPSAGSGNATVYAVGK